MHPAEKRLNEMNRLGDMLHFPAVVNGGATINVLLTVLVTWWAAPQHPALAGVWLAAVLILNLLPVVLLRLTIDETTEYPKLAEMDFFRDQHKFSDWVYVAASAYMAVWVLLAWTVALVHHTAGALVSVEMVAAFATFSPVIARAFRRRR
jgi:hypothetical protein